MYVFFMPCNAELPVKYQLIHKMTWLVFEDIHFIYY